MQNSKLKFKNQKFQLPDLNCEKETRRIINFIKKTLEKQKVKKVIIGLSGGIDSTTSLYHLKNSIPKENIILAHLYYFEPLNLKQIIFDIPRENYYNFSIKKAVDEITGELKILNQVQDDNKKRIGNIMARVRMIILYDLAKKHNALVCGTENKSEHLLGYYTRFGDEASDIEPIRHLYKSQVYQLAKYLGVPKDVIKTAPTAGLWKGQTDEEEFGFSYQEADEVLYLHFDKKMKVEEIQKKGFANAEKIIEFSKRNKYKHTTPYALDSSRRHPF